MVAFTLSSSNQDGQLAGTSVADAVITRFNQADESPKLQWSAFDGQSDAVTKNIRDYGKVLDNL